MALRIRSKFISILAIAAGLPLALALTAVEVIGHGQFRSACGRAYAAEGARVARELAAALRAKTEQLYHWTEFVDLYGGITAYDASAPVPDEAAIAAIEARWPKINRAARNVPGTPTAAGSAELAAVLAHPLAAKMAQFRGLNPEFVELLVTDAAGRLVAATGQTSDYWQADEDWWRAAIASPGGQPALSGIHFDDSAQVYSVDVIIPLRDPANPSGPSAGVFKAVLAVVPVFAGAEHFAAEDTRLRDVVLADGRVLARVGGRITPFDQAFPPPAANWLQAAPEGWVDVAAPGDGARHLAGFARLNLNPPGLPGFDAGGLEPLTVVVHRDRAAVMAPIRAGSIIAVVAGALLAAGFGMVGLVIANRQFLGPIAEMRSAARSLALAAAADSKPSAEAATAAHGVLAGLRRIDSKDELGELAAEFAGMAEQLLGYHERLERGIAAKTAEIHRDLEFAREFQLALMPRDYPVIVSPDSGLGLRFSHVYEPASSLGGDFCSVFPLGPDRAAVFIADVMGHGSRSALVTAILATLQQNLARRTEDPGRFLELLNSEFHRLARSSPDPIFATAGYLVLDAGRGVAAFANAGHPVPLCGRRHQAAVEPLTGPLRDQPALGLFPEHTYQTTTRPLHPGDLFFLFTDGTFEVEDPDGQIFGLARLGAELARHTDHELVALTRAVFTEVGRFAGTAALPDDLCLIGVEVVVDGAVAPGAAVPPGG